MTARNVKYDFLLEQFAGLTHCPAAVVQIIRDLSIQFKGSKGVVYVPVISLICTHCRHK